MGRVQYFQFALDQAIEVPLIFNPDKDFFFSLTLARDLSQGFNYLEIKVVGVALIGQLYLPVISVLVVDIDADSSADEIDDIVRFDCEIDLFASI